MSRLNTIRNNIFQARTYLIAAILISLTLALIFWRFYKRELRSPDVKPLPPSQQPVINGRFDATAQVSQDSRNQIARLNLPVNTTITTSIGSRVMVSIWLKPTDPYTLYVDLTGVDFQIPENDSSLPRVVQNFRDSAIFVLDWVKSQGSDPAAIFILWGDKRYIQERAETWITPSEKFPSVIKKGNDYFFERQNEK